MIPLLERGQKLVIVGRTGSGKTQAGVYHLSMVDFENMPWVIFDYKIDPLINSIVGIQHLGLDSTPDGPGIYAYHPQPEVDDDAVNKLLYTFWRRENVGIYVDEGYMLSKMKAFSTILQQGRSKNLPMIILSQRPVFMNRFVFSESDYWQVFALKVDDDIKRIKTVVTNYDPKTLRPYWSLYYSVAQDKEWLLRPVPQAAALKKDIQTRLAAMIEEDIVMDAKPTRVKFI